MPSAGAARFSLLQATIAVKGRFNSSSQRGVGKEALPPSLPAPREGSTTLFCGESCNGGWQQNCLSAWVQGQGRLVGSDTPPILGCRLKVSPCRAGVFPPPAKVCLTVFRQKDWSCLLPELTSSPICLLGSPKYTGLWDSHLVLTWGPFSKTDDTVFLSQTVRGF